MTEQTIKDRYFSLLRTSLEGSEDEVLAEAADLGRELMLTKVPLGEITRMHEEAVGRLANEAPEMTLSDAARSTTAPLTELITAYDLSFRESESLYRLLAENVTDIIWNVDMDLNFTYVSPSAERLIGYTVEEAMSQTLDKVLAPSSSETIMKILEEELAIEKKEQKDLFRVRMFEAEIRCKDGSTVWTETRASFLRDQNGQAVGILGVTRDITERMRAEEILQKEQAETLRLKTFLENVMNSMLTGLLVTDGSGKIMIINRIGQEILGTTEREAVGRPIEKLSPDLTILRKIVAPADLAQEAMVTLSDERVIPLGFTSNILRDANGREAGVLTVFKDLTEIKELRNELRAKEKLATMGEVAGGIAHEIRNPLFAISSGIQILESELRLDDEQKKTLNIIFEETMRVDRLIKQLLDFTARQELKRTSLQITTLINEVISLNRGLLQPKDIKIRKSLSEDMPPLNGDRDRIIQVLVNLLQNAIDVSRRGDTIEIICDIDEDGQYAVIQVKDNGPGIPKEQRERVFDLFFTTKKGNSGMGLAIAKKILLEHGGDIRVGPRKERGATFVVEIPLE